MAKRLDPKLLQVIVAESSEQVELDAMLGESGCVACKAEPFQPLLAMSRRLLNALTVAAPEDDATRPSVAESHRREFGFAGLQ